MMLFFVCACCVFFFKQKTAYEMRISDWSSDVCSSDLRQVVEHREYLIDEKGIAPLPNAPFALSTPEGDPLPHGIVTRDLIHAFYNNQLQINGGRNDGRSEEHTSELQSLMRISYAVFCLKKKKNK